MRILPAALAISAAVHGVAIAWVQTRPAPAPQVARAVTPPIEIVDIEEPPVAVALLDHHSVSPAVARSPQPESHAAPTASSARISTGHTAGNSTTGTAGETPGPSAPAHSSLMDMRKPSAPEVSHGISEDFVTNFLAHSKPLQPKAIEGERIEDDLARDEQHLHDSRWVANATPNEVASAREALEMDRARSAGHELKRDGTGYKATHTTFVAKVDGDGTTHIEDKANIQRQGLLGASFDVTDAMMRHFGDDPYASNKRKFLDETREERFQIGTEYKHRQLAHSTQLMRGNIDRLWATQATLEARKRALFELWDECAETGADDVVSGGSEARKLVVGAIRTRLTGADAYTRSELATLNAHRMSRATFAPYDD